MMSVLIPLLISVAVLLMLNAAYSMLRAMQLREQLISHTEEVAANPEVLSDPMRRRSFLVRWADRYDRAPKAQSIQERLRRAYVPWKPSDFQAFRVAVSLAAFALIWFLFTIPIIPAIALCCAVYFFGPRVFFASRRNAYVNAFEAQLVEITQLLANSMRAGMSVQQSIGQVVERLPEPACGEFRQTYHELKMGHSLTDAMNGLCKRVRSRDLDVLVNTIVIQHQAGGNLARVLAGMSNMLTERQRLASEIRSLTADARFSALIVMFMPIVVIFMLRNTPLGEAIFETIPGWILLTVFALVQVGNYLIIQRIARIEV